VSEPDHLALTPCALSAVPPFLTLPLNDNSEFPIAEAKVLEWEELYRAIDMRKEIRAYKGWAVNNPTRRKTRKGILASVNSWLVRSHDNSRINQNCGELLSKSGRASRLAGLCTARHT
jgi:hypothetical protein